MVDIPAADLQTTERHNKPLENPVRRPTITEQPVRDMWINNDMLPYPTTEPLSHGDLSLVSVVNEHRLEARRGNLVIWSFTADARITDQPVIHDGRIYLPAADGWVTCLNPADGAVLWRSLVAPAKRWIMAYGQLESAWPVTKLAVHNNAVVAAAGRHPEVDGGIHVVALNPANGQRQVLEVIANDTANTWFAADDRRRNSRHLNWITNGGMDLREGALILRGLDRVHGGGNKIERKEPWVIGQE